jgi:hypothetical protein
MPRRPLHTQQLAHPRAQTSLIVAAVKQELAKRVGEVIEIESDEEENPEPEVSRVETLVRTVSAARRSLLPVQKCRLPTSA